MNVAIPNVAAVHAVPLVAPDVAPTYTARYAVIPAAHTLRVETETIAADLRPHDILLEGESSVISAGTELANYTALDTNVYKEGAYNAYPYRPGYGMVGRVLAVGSATTHLKAGERVLSMAKHASMQRYSLAPKEQPYHNAYPIGDTISGHTAAMLRMALVALTAPQGSYIQPGDTVAVFGLGVVGNLAAQIYRAAGARVIGFDPLESRCAYARRVGIETALALPPDQQQEAIRELTAGKGVQVAVDAVGHARIIETAVFACANYGEVVLLGSPRAAATFDVTPLFSHIHLHFLTVRGALEWQQPPYASAGQGATIAGNVRRLLQMVEAGQLQLDAIISHRVLPDDLPQTYAGLAASPQDYMGVIIDWTTQHAPRS